MRLMIDRGHQLPLTRQAAMLGYINAFGFYTLASALAIPLILFVGRRARAR